MKRIVTAVTAALMVVVMGFSTAAATAADYTGWDMNTGALRYMLNGTPVKDAWVKHGKMFYYVGSEGYTVPNFVVNEDGLKASVIQSYYDANKGGTLEQVQRDPYIPYEAVKKYYNVADDYEAFKKLHPEVVALYAGDNVNLYQYYLSTYHGTTPTTVYLDALQRCVTDTYSSHNYTYIYEYIGNDTHKAFCSCGAWVEETCTKKDKHHNGDEKCPFCGHHF